MTDKYVSEYVSESPVGMVNVECLNVCFCHSIVFGVLCMGKAVTEQYLTVLSKHST